MVRRLTKVSCYNLKHVSCTLLFFGGCCGGGKRNDYFEDAQTVLEKALADRQISVGFLVTLFNSVPARASPAEFRCNANQTHPKKLPKVFGII